MTNNQLTRERLEKIKSWRETYGAGRNVMLPAEEAEELACLALAAIDSKPFAYIIQDKYERERGVEGHLSRSHVSKYVSQEDINEHEITCTPLYRHTQQPVVPDGYVMVPVKPTREILDEFDSIIDYGAEDSVDAWHRLLAAAPQSPGSEPATVPGKWIPVSERMPETDGNYWGWWSESKRQGPVWFIKSELQAQFQSSEITHWMPLPAAPQEVK
ncbi:DUF551 domain-containing protein [Klebsiella sp. CN_Kp118]|uniref:DUF551 domain-containing protein n=1 Tax=Klebsiella sp. CN_Kp118 TaxID=3153432 RepID=UPI0032B37E74